LGYKYAGVEYAHECYCGNELRSDATIASGNAVCETPCAGDANQICGGTWTITVYEGPTVLPSYNDWTEQGCFVDSVAARIVPNGVAVDGSFTPGACMDKCASLGFPYAGLEYMHECYCADSTLNTASLTSSDQCIMACDGDQAHICGGGNAVTLYYSPTVASATTSKDTGLWSSTGCFTDSVSDRALSLQVFVEGAMTVEKCTTACLAHDLTLAGVEYGAECYCADAFSGSNGQPATDGCTMPCAGDSTELCGGGNRLNVFTYTGTITTPAGPTVLATANSFDSVGCFVDAVEARVMTPVTVAGLMTVEGCTSACSTNGYTFAGLEWAQECYCSNTLPAQQADDATSCNMACAGDSAHLCGGPVRLNVYQQVTQGGDR